MTVVSKTTEPNEELKFPCLRKDKIGNVFLFMDRETCFMVGGTGLPSVGLTGDREPTNISDTYNFTGEITLRNAK